MMRWATEELLIQKIGELQSKSLKMEGDNVLLAQYSKELEILQRLKIEGIDLSGSVGVVSERLKNNSVYFMDKAEFDSMSAKASKLDVVRRILATLYD